MNAKKYLKQYAIIQGRCERLMEEIETLRAEAEAVSMAADGMPKAPGVSDRVGNIAASLADLWADYETVLSDLWDKRKEITETIGKVENPTHARLLFDRYIKLMKWSDVARDLYMDEVYTRGSLHGAALLSVEKILSNV